MTEKYVVVFDTLCEGHQCWEDENGKPCLFDTIEEAENEIQEHFELSNEGRDEPYEEPMSLFCLCLNLSKAEKQFS